MDIVLERGAGAIAGVEVKAAASVSESDFRGLRKLKEIAGARFTHGVAVRGRSLHSFQRTFSRRPLRMLWDEA